MTTHRRVGDALNAALGTLLAEDPALYLLGEDIADPYGGAFGITRGLSTRFPRQVITTPISEAGIVGVANGLALAGDKAIVEMMFADFVALAFDQIVNFAAKSTTMYGHPVPMPVVVRCPTGGNRGYGPTHSQSPQKHFIGVPGLDVYELSPYHDPVALLRELLGSGRPSLLFEDKTLYAAPLRPDDLFRVTHLGGTAEVRVDDDIPADDYLIVAPGGLTGRATAAMRSLLLRHELSGRLLVPARLHPLDLDPLLRAATSTSRVVVVEDGPPGAAWGTEVAYRLQQALWGTSSGPVRLCQAADGVIPTAAHLEREVLVQAETIVQAVLEAHR
ncbi:alpha-ketoacid dehydrogenase subunit beta [Dactylosporangium cerinum]|uniref:Alpha-ketoacid dehydrogenase subunit beta n=1 Tax=Dactylosporangium cerinum TaxID=1434730 RepID=A0ABV9W2I3_9ACTN